MRVGVRRVRLALSRSQIKSVVGRSFRNANHLAVAARAISLVSSAWELWLTVHSRHLPHVPHQHRAEGRACPVRSLA